MSRETPIVIEEKYSASAAAVWDALTNKASMKEWYFDIPDFILAEGSSFEFYEPGGANKYLHRCTIKEIIPEKKFVHTWAYPLLGGGESIVTWQLQREDQQQCSVTLTHEGIENFPDTPEFVRGSFVMGWSEILGTMLRRYLETSTNPHLQTAVSH